ncbi:amidohydrolase family protein [Sphingobacterium sp. PCS056]|jgi:cytosine/adenosine deaminase-related metal-dependent hydrolase|uniref:amidohydrolase family protein n=1 Tax=Sphingobacterium TaxID=28453 RepID=UPI00200F3F91|nr:MULTISPECIES: amidohydrolase family protein [unclassified Sphingobacterium]UPZ37344.1 amidohydrolase family protein [Sphingobacterium sp. PCS056]
MKYFSANYILPITSLPIKDGVVKVNDEGEILAIYESKAAELKDQHIEKFEGVIVPGFINAHCHLELSHMKGTIPQKTGLPAFLSAVMTSRSASLKVIDKAMAEADAEMYNNGIVAVGDHVNSDNTSKIKESSKILYHTFVEIFGVEPEEADGKLQEAKDLIHEFDPAHSSLTPHAPYSCSKILLKKFKKAVSDVNIISIHNQESDDENKLFRYKTGGFIDFFKTIGKNPDLFKAQARNSIQSYLPYLPHPNKLILVHNTFTSLKDLDFVDRMGRDIVWCLCPKANLYIEDQLPKVLNFVNDNQKIVIGTDSLASNDTLSILDELKVLHKHFDNLDFQQSIQWATINGAQALNIDREFGSIEVGKKPGLVLLKNMEHFRLTDKVTVQRLV